MDNDRPLSIKFMETFREVIRICNDNPEKIVDLKNNDDEFANLINKLSYYAEDISDKIESNPKTFYTHVDQEFIKFNKKFNSEYKKYMPRTHKSDKFSGEYLAARADVEYDYDCNEDPELLFYIIPEIVLETIKEKFDVDVLIMERRRVKLGTLFISPHFSNRHNAPDIDSFFMNFREARIAFIHNLDRAAVCLLRSTVDIMLTTHCNATAEDLDQKINIAHSKKFITSEECKALQSLRKFANEILHPEPISKNQPYVKYTDSHKEDQMVQYFQMLDQLIDRFDRQYPSKVSS